MSGRVRDRMVWAASLAVALAPAGWVSGTVAVGAEPGTPATRTLSAADADGVLQRDWLFQAMGEPLAGRAAKEIGWARKLAGRIGAGADGPDLAGELGELKALERRLATLSGRPAAVGKAQAAPSWIWFSKGQASQDAPVAPRWFRRRFDLPAGASVRGAELRITVDDAFEAFVNGVRLAGNAEWGKPQAFAVGKHLKAGANVLAVRAENRAAPVTKNPAGLIAVLDVALSDDRHVRVVSDGSWRATQDKPSGWQAASFDDAAWKPANVTAPFGGGVWKRVSGILTGGGTSASYAHESPAVRELYFAVRRVKRRILLKNPAVDFDRLLFIDQPYPHGSEWPHQSIHRMGIKATPGGRLLVLDGLHPGGRIRKLAPSRSGSFWRPDLSFDAKRVLFCYKAHDEGSFHLYEIGMDGSARRQLTTGPYDDIDPIYLPDGRLMFTTTRGNSYVRCGPYIYSTILARCQSDGSDIYLISYGNETEWTPALLNDGRVIYSRWEYTDKALWRIQSLWTTNQDGTGTAAFWGNQSVWPDHLSEPRPVPGSQRVMFSGVGHHDWFSGSIGLVDPAKGMNFPLGLTKVTGDLPWAESGTPPLDPKESADYHASGRFTGYKTPYPIAKEDFLVSARGASGKFRLYLMDFAGNRELIYEGAHNIWHAIPVKPRRRPPQHVDRVAWPGTGPRRRPAKLGHFYSADVYQGVGDLPRGRAKYLRVFQMDYKTYSTWNKTYRNSGPTVSIVQEEGVKRIVSVVPIESDGSVYFQASPGQALHFQLLDEHYRCLQTMRSFTGVMPGERRGCVGCHESHSTTPPTRQALALRRGPTPPTPPPWGTESISYERFAQPVLDRYCGKCHQGKGKGRKKLDLTLRPGHGPFKEPYLTLVGAAGWGSPARGGRGGYGIAGAIPVETLDRTTRHPKAYVTLRPMRYLSYKSELVARAMSGKHHKVKADPLSLRRLIAWVDACCPYRGDPEVRSVADPAFAGIEKLPIRPRVRTAPVIVRP